MSVESHFESSPNSRSGVFQNKRHYFETGLGQSLEVGGLGESHSIHIFISGDTGRSLEVVEESGSTVYCFVISYIPDLLHFDGQLVEWPTVGQTTHLFNLDILYFTIYIVSVTNHFTR